MKFRPLHTRQTVTISRASVTIEDGVELPGTPTVIGTPSAGVEDVTAELRRGPEGRDVALGLRLWLDDLLTEYRQGDTVTLTYRGETRVLEVTEVKGPFGSLYDHVQLLAEQASEAT